jgi:hypothetical protein
MELHPAAVEDRLTALCDRLEATTEQYAAACRAGAAAEADYKERYLRTLAGLDATRLSGAAKEQQARTAALSLLRPQLVAEAEVRVLRAALDTLTTLIEAQRTLNANVRYLTAPS